MTINWIKSTQDIPKVGQDVVIRRVDPDFVMPEECIQYQHPDYEYFAGPIFNKKTPYLAIRGVPNDKKWMYPLIAKSPKAYGYPYSWFLIDKINWINITASQPERYQIVLIRILKAQSKCYQYYTGPVLGHKNLPWVGQRGKIRDREWRCELWCNDFEWFLISHREKDREELKDYRYPYKRRGSVWGRR